MKLIDLAVPFFVPVWRRIVTVLVCFAWGSFEFSQATPLWGMIFFGIGGVCAWRFSTIDYAVILEQEKPLEK